MRRSNFSRRGVHPGLAADAAIDLREQGRRNRNIRNSSQENRGDKTGEIADTPPPNDTTKEVRSSPAALMCSQSAPACAIDFALFPARNAIEVNGKPASRQAVANVRSKSGATFASEINRTTVSGEHGLTSVPVSASNPGPISTS